MSLFRKVSARVMRWLHLANIYVVPTTRWGDRLISYYRSINNNGRRPNRPSHFNDRIYRLKVSDEILSPLRVFISDKEYGKIFATGVLGENRTAKTLAVLKTV